MPDRAERFARLLEQARDLPRTPGVYLMKDANGVVLYVGKARALRSRVASYFQAATVSAAPDSPGGLGPKKQLMLDRIDTFDFIECDTEWEALLTENRLIKDLKPRFNERLTDDKSFPYLVITTREEFPGVYITREPNNPRFRGAKVFGPFTQAYALHESVRLLQRVFKFRTCELEIREDDPKRRFFRPCLLHPIEQCMAPCGAKISKEAYREDIDRFVRFIGSKRSAMLREMRREMELAAGQLRFEKAAALRDQVRALEKLDERGQRSTGWQPETESFYGDPMRGVRSLRRALGMEAEPRTLECIDIAHLGGRETVGSKVCFADGRPFKDAYRRYKVRTARAGDDYDAIREVVSRAYREAGAGNELYPDLIVIDGGPGQLQAARQALADLPHRPPGLIALSKKNELIHTPDRPDAIRLGRENPGLKLVQAARDEAHRFAQHYHHILRRKRVLER